ncbi:hypothetical protein [Actinopolyspora halophila]|uniref:hypothetical protein n=1 Tax=Actinopolyspora halophila TaxID=1850 RepID=UPI0003695D15|nr:hypothetical protein [Actinopolyspora halophila]
MSATPPNVRLGVLVAHEQWHLQAMSLAIGGQTCTAEQCRATAERLDQLAAALREHAAAFPTEELAPSETAVIEGSAGNE